MSEKLFIQVGNDKIEADKETLDYIKAWQDDVKVHEAEQEARKLARESAFAKLAALGLTEEEIAAL
jgi:hypothetical protein